MTPPDPTKPFNDLPPLPPAVDLETKPVLRACIEARSALAELNQAGALLPNQAMLINTVPLLEAQSSSAIENVVTTSDRLFRFAQASQGSEIDAATKEALRYRSALWQGVQSVKRRPLSTATAIDVCRELLGIDIDIRQVPGTALVNESTGQVIYTPPVGKDLLRRQLSNWETFLHRANGLDPLIRMAVGHYQFEAIHPFTDGNGRTGRILNLLFLVDQHLLDIPVLYLSRYILRHRAIYYRLLRRVTFEEAWQDWIRFMLEAVQDTARWTTDRIRRIRQLSEATAAHIRERLPASYSRELAELIFVQPYCRIRNVVAADIAKRQTASTYLKKLSEIGVLEEFKVGREKIFINIRLMRLLTLEDPGALDFT